MHSPEHIQFSCTLRLGNRLHTRRRRVCDGVSEELKPLQNLELRNHLFASETCEGLLESGIVLRWPYDLRPDHSAIILVTLGTNDHIKPRRFAGARIPSNTICDYTHHCCNSRRISLPLASTSTVLPADQRIWPITFAMASAEPERLLWLPIESS